MTTQRDGTRIVAVCSTRCRKALAIDMALAVEERMYQRYGGKMHYIADGARAERERLFDAIWTGRNHRAVMVRLGVSKSTLYRMIERRRVK